MRSPVDDKARNTAHYRQPMKKLALLLLAAALVAVLASLTFKKRSTTPEAPEGSWELAEADQPS